MSTSEHSELDAFFADWDQTYPPEFNKPFRHPMVMQCLQSWAAAMKTSIGAIELLDGSALHMLGYFQQFSTIHPVHQMTIIAEMLELMMDLTVKVTAENPNYQAITNRRSRQ
ncbi:MAG: hypothetical protein K2W93_13800 [Burkholderiaceae bacterium]|nr:hypothetical protein [Burkholderiaceae bacterium]